MGAPEVRLGDPDVARRGERSMRAGLGCLAESKRTLSLAPPQDYREGRANRKVPGKSDRAGGSGKALADTCWVSQQSFSFRFCEMSKNAGGLSQPGPFQIYDGGV